jgi:hypothetical protein
VNDPLVAGSLGELIEQIHCFQVLAVTGFLKLRVDLSQIVPFECGFPRHFPRQQSSAQCSVGEHRDIVFVAIAQDILLYIPFE